MASHLVVSPSGRLRCVVPSTSPPLQRFSSPQPMRAPTAVAGPPMLLNGAAAPPGLQSVARVPKRCGVPRAELGRRRTLVAGDSALGDRYLADRRVTPRTASNYRSAYNAFVFWAAQNHFWLSVPDLDSSLCRYLLHFFFDGGAAFDARYICATYQSDWTTI